MNVRMNGNVGKVLPREVEWRELVNILLHDSGEFPLGESEAARKRELLQRLMGAAG